MRTCDEVIECFLVSGQSDYVLRIACESHDPPRTRGASGRRAADRVLPVDP